MCPHCADHMRTIEFTKFRCPTCHSLFEISDAMMETDLVLGSGEVFCEEVYRGPSVKESD